MSLFTIHTDGQLDPGVSQEWLLTNGTGAYSGSTVVGCNIRRYHGLLVAATLPPVGRIVALSRVGELINFDGQEATHELSVNQFAGNFHPHGERYLKTFHLDEFAQWDFAVEGATITKQLMLLQNRNTIALRYIIDPKNHPLTMQLIPFLAMRDFHAVRFGTSGDFAIDVHNHRASIKHEGNTLHLHCDAGPFVEGRDWWRGHFYAIDAERGQEHIEDLFVPGRFTFQITKPTTVMVIASLDPIEAVDWDAELGRHATRGVAATGSSVTIQKLHRAANDFIVARKSPDGSDGTTVIAGYPWFADWGRDTMISLPGLLLATKRFKEAAQVLSVFAQYVRDGMIPNRFEDYTNEPSYNTVDASLWFIQACFEYLKASKDSNTFETCLLPACCAIIEGHIKGTRYGIRMDENDGLITQGDATTQLTWMDAKCNNVAFTPRQGKAVEINALWYNALKLLGENDLAAKVQSNYAKAFWINPFRGLYDVVDGPRKDAKIRPNQIFAVSLPHSPLTAEQQQAVVEIVRRELLTPYGLRTLAPGDPQFKAVYRGDQFRRDEAYHNGTIWPWLIGPFLEAYLKVNKHSAAAKSQVKTWLTPLLEAMNTHGCIGQIAEIYEAQPPHRPAGCFAQAWSIAEVLRIASEIGL